MQQFTQAWDMLVHYRMLIITLSFRSHANALLSCIYFINIFVPKVTSAVIYVTLIMCSHELQLSEYFRSTVQTAYKNFSLRLLSEGRLFTAISVSISHSYSHVRSFLSPPQSRFLHAHTKWSNTAQSL